MDSPKRKRANGALRGVPRSVSSRLVKLLRQHLPAQPLEVPFDGGGSLALALCSRFFVELTCTQFGQQAAFLNRAFEAAQSHFKWLVLFKANGRHQWVQVLGLTSALAQSGKPVILSDNCYA